MPWLESLVQCWIKAGEQASLFLILEKNIQPFTVKYDVNCRVFVNAFHQVEEIPFYLFVDFFLLLLWQGDGFCEYFFCIYWNDCFFFYLYSVTVHNIVLIYYCMLNQPCVHTWSTILFMIQFASLLLRIFVFIFLGSLDCSFIFLGMSLSKFYIYYLIFTYFWISFCYWFLSSFHCGQRTYVVWF